MGGSESKRKLIVEDENIEGEIELSDGVIRRLRGMPDHPEKGSSNNKDNNAPAKQSPKPDTNNNETQKTPEPTRDDERLQKMTKKIEDFYEEKLNDLSKRSKELQDHSNEQFATAVKEVEQKFLKYTSSPVCQDLQAKLLECYQTKPDSILDCSPVVHAFSTCVDRARMAASQTCPLSQVPQPVSS